MQQGHDELEPEAPCRLLGALHLAEMERIGKVDLHETDGVTKQTYRLAFRDKAGRDHMRKTDGLEANYDNVAALVRSLLDPTGTVSG